SAIHTPKLTATALPPRPLSHGEKACPKIGARPTGSSAHPLTPKAYLASETGSAPLSTSSSSASRPHVLPPTSSTLVAPGLPSPTVRISRLSASRPSQYENISDPLAKPRI